MTDQAIVISATAATALAVRRRLHEWGSHAQSFHLDDPKTGQRGSKLIVTFDPTAALPATEFLERRAKLENWFLAVPPGTGFVTCTNLEELRSHIDVPKNGFTAAEAIAKWLAEDHNLKLDVWDVRTIANVIEMHTNARQMALKLANARQDLRKALEEIEGDLAS